MRVELVQATSNAVKILADIGSICYGHEEAKNPSALIRNLNKLGHHSVFEHAFYTFKIKGISRACLAQLTRHRHASFTVRSQRYCDESDTEFIIPNKILENNEACSKFEDLIWNMQELYEDMIESGIKREDARAILPQATSTDLYMTLNLRELIHIWKLRVASDAQQEISDLVSEMVSLVVKADEELGQLFAKELV